VNRKRILPPTYFCVSAAAMIAVHFLLPIRKIVPAPYNFGGIVLILLGCAVNVWADRLFKRAKTVVEPFERSSSLITSGPYRFSRHPMYVGMIAALAGLAALLGTLAPALVVPAFAAVIRLRFIPAEEKAMAQTFGQAYEQYRKRVRRWL
jgi:protein-S-isoprenylcysteine O-methyltransferase Ste14